MVGLNILLWNAHSLNLNKQVQLQLHRQHADVVAITETWHANEHDPQYQPNSKRNHLGGYPFAIHRPYRLGKAGVSLYSKYPLVNERNYRNIHQISHLLR